MKTGGSEGEEHCEVHSGSLSRNRGKKWGSDLVDTIPKRAFRWHVKRCPHPGPSRYAHLLEQPELEEHLGHVCGDKEFCTTPLEKVWYILTKYFIGDKD